MKILLVDDDPDAIQTLQSTLGAAGSHEFLTANSAGAMDAAEVAGTLDLLITNVVMESVDGFTLCSSLAGRFPGLKTIFTTEYDLSEYAEQTAGYDVLSKPVDQWALLTAFRRTVGTPESTAPLPEADSPAPKQSAGPEAPAPFAPSAAAAREEPLAPGAVIGGFKIVEQAGVGKWGRVYQATRTQSNRPVTLELLPASLRGTPSEATFLAEAQARAKIRHLAVVSVYNTEEAGEHLFLVGEFIPGRTLAAIAAAGESIPEKLATEVVRAVADALARFSQSRAPHAGVTAADIWIGKDKRPRVANLIATEGTAPTAQQEMRALSKIIQSVLPGGKAATPAFATLLARMDEGGHAGFSSWLILLEEAGGSLKAPPGAAPSPAKEPRPAPAVEDEEKPKKGWLRWLLAVVWAVLGVAALFYLGRFLYGNFFKPKDFDAMVEVPGGSFIYQDNLKLHLPTFWIDKYEVTIAQYAQFLDELEKNPTTKYDSPGQPKEKTSHKPKDWDVYYRAATTTRMAGDVPIDPACPVFLVDWFDAYAYAKWKGRRLPTEMEWEKAGRGPDGFIYPWGNTPDAKKCNSIADYSDDPKLGGNIDGYNRWSPVNAILADQSVYGVIDMAGNVAEWTGTWDPEAKIPVVRGGTFHSPDYQLTRRSVLLEADQASEYVGFRTATSEPPPK